MMSSLQTPQISLVALKNINLYLPARNKFLFLFAEAAALTSLQININDCQTAFIDIVFKYFT